MRAPRWDIETIVGYTLQIGVMLSLTLIGVGLVWHRAARGTWQFDYMLPATSVVGFVASDVREVTSEAARPRLLVNVGIAVLLLTPYVRVLASMLYFAFVERNVKYAVFTALVLGMLTYALLGGG